MLIGTLEINNNLFLAPMAGYSDRAFRVTAKRHGAGMVFTEMVSARGLIHGNKSTQRYLLTSPEEYPLSAQIFGAEPEPMAEAARLIAEKGIPAVDVNMGCPMRKVVKGGAGSALLQDLPRAEKILTAVRKAVSLTLTVKIRSGWDSKTVNCRETARMAEGCGVDAVMIHGRTSRQMFSGNAEWRWIRDAKESVSIPVIGNGDVRTPEDALRMEAETGCDGVMIGRAALGNPWIFERILALRSGNILPPPGPPARMMTILAHIDLLRDLYEEEVGVNRFKSHIIHYLKGIRGVKELRRQVCTETKTVAELWERIRNFFEAYEEAHFLLDDDSDTCGSVITGRAG